MPRELKHLSIFLFLQGALAGFFLFLLVYWFHVAHPRLPGEVISPLNHLSGVAYAAFAFVMMGAAHFLVPALATGILFASLPHKFQKVVCAAALAAACFMALSFLIKPGLSLFVFGALTISAVPCAVICSLWLERPNGAARSDPTKQWRHWSKVQVIAAAAITAFVFISRFEKQNLQEAPILGSAEFWARPFEPDTGRDRAKDQKPGFIRLINSKGSVCRVNSGEREIAPGSVPTKPMRSTPSITYSCLVHDNLGRWQNFSEGYFGCAEGWVHRWSEWSIGLHHETTWMDSDFQRCSPPVN